MTGILICCTCSFWSGSLCLFGFCLLVSSVSNFRPDTRGRWWSLVQVHLFSRAAGREGRCRQISLACVGSTRSVQPHWVCPAHGCVLSPSTPLRLLAALHVAGPALRAVPVFRSSTKAQTQLGLRFVPSPAEQLRQPGAWRLGAVRLIPSAVPASVSHVPRLELVSSCDPPGGCQPARISGGLWLETGNLFSVW